MAGNILVFAERRDGSLKRSSLEALSAAGKLAEVLGGRVDAVSLGQGAGSDAAVLGQHGAKRLLVFEEDRLSSYAPEAYAAAVAAAAKEADADLVLFSATSMGKDLSARTAAILETAVLSDVTSIEIGEDGAVRCERPVFSGKAVATVSIPKRRPAFATLRPNLFPVDEPEGSGDAELVSMTLDLPDEKIRVRAVRLEKPAEQELDVAEASVVVSGGGGIKDPKNFELIRSLAEPLGAAVGASRAAVDAGWIPHSHQVGQTGKVVSPNLYIACGISGAIQHLAGMSSAKIIVAINKDPEAPIFKVADYGIVGDLFEVIPKVVEEIGKLGA